MAKKIQFKSTFISTNDLLKIVKQVVKRYALKKAIPGKDIEDVEMAIVEKFLTQEKKISTAFKGDSKVSTYCIAIVNRMCCEIIRKDYKNWQQAEHNEQKLEFENKTDEFDTEKKTIINSEVKRLTQILDFFDAEKNKVVICIEFINNIPLTQKNLKEYARDKYEFVNQILNKNIEAQLAEKYNVLAQMVNIVEEKQVKGDAIRMYLNKHVDKIICRLNGNGFSKYDKKSLYILFELTNVQLIAS